MRELGVGKCGILGLFDKKSSAKGSCLLFGETVKSSIFLIFLFLPFFALYTVVMKLS